MYGYLHQGRVLSFDEDSGGYNLQSVGLARTSRWGPVPSAVPGLLVGDRVVLGATGVSRDNLVIIAKIGMTFPGIPDIPGLVAALAGKADDSEITAILADLTALDGRLDVVEAAAVALDGRLDVVEPIVTTHTGELTSLDGRLDTAETSLTSHSGRLAYLENTCTTDRDLFGDILSNMPRHTVTDAVALTNGVLVLVRMYCKPGATISVMRVVTTVAGTVGTSTAGIYAGTTTSNFALVRSGAITLGGPGRINFTPSTPYVVGASAQLLAAFLPLSYSTLPQMGGRTGVVHSQLLNPTGAFYSSVTKASVAALPSTVDLADGSWNAAVTSQPWVAFG